MTMRGPCSVSIAEDVEDGRLVGQRGARLEPRRPGAPAAASGASLSRAANGKPPASFARRTADVEPLAPLRPQPVDEVGREAPTRASMRPSAAFLPGPHVGAEVEEPPGRAERLAADALERRVERDDAVVGRVEEVHDLALARRRRREPRMAGVDAGVEDRDDDAPPVGVRVCGEELARAQVDRREERVFERPGGGAASAGGASPAPASASGSRHHARRSEAGGHATPMVFASPCSRRSRDRSGRVEGCPQVDDDPRWSGAATGHRRRQEARAPVASKPAAAGSAERPRARAPRASGPRRQGRDRRRQPDGSSGAHRGDREDAEVECGAGGTVKGRVVEIQGDHRDRIVEVLGDARHRREARGRLSSARTKPARSAARTGTTTKSRTQPRELRRDPTRGRLRDDDLRSRREHAGRRAPRRSAPGCRSARARRPPRPSSGRRRSGRRSSSARSRRRPTTSMREPVRSELPGGTD